MKKNPLALIVAGIVILLLGVVLSISGGAPKADPVMAQQCRDRMIASKADDSMVRQCSEVAFATAMTSTNANAAAQAISAANNSELGGSMLSKFLLGLGMALLLGGIYLRRKLAQSSN